MNYKRGLFVLLAGVVLLGPVTSHYAITLDEIKNKVSSFLSEDTFKKILPVFAITFAAGLYYWWTRGGGGGGEKPTSIIEQKMFSLGVSLAQLQVYSQFNRDAGGAASCGYQTLLRGMQVISAKSNNESNEDLEKTLMDPVPVVVYFGPNGEWRQDIIEKRKKIAFKKMLHEKFILCLAKDCDSKVQAEYGSEVYKPIIADLKSKKLSADKANYLYQSALGYLEEIVMSIAKDPEQMINQYDFTDDAIYNYLQKSLERFKNPINEALIEILQKPEMIKECFDLEKMREEFLSKDFIFDLPVLVKKMYQDPNLQEDFKGEWLSDEELQYLWQNHRFDIIPMNVNCGFKAIGNFELVDNSQYPKEFDEVAIYIDQNVKSLLNKKQQMFQLFGLGTMRQSGDKDTIQGHWYPLVMYQNSEGKRHYYIMDSANNHNRTNDENAWKIINLIEKAAPVEIKEEEI